MAEKLDDQLSYSLSVMQLSKKNVAGLTIFVALIVLSTGCTSVPPASRSLYEDATRILRLEVTPRSSHHKHSHPAHISLEKLERDLSAVTVEPQPSSDAQQFAYTEVPRLTKSSRAFSPDTVRFLSHYLKQGLERATPLEEVVFFLSDRQPNGVTLITNGSCYWDNDQLHLLVANYQHPTIGDHETINARADPLKVLANPIYNLIPGIHAKKKSTKGWEALIAGVPQHIVFESAHLDDIGHASKGSDKQNDIEQRLHPQSFSERLKELERLKGEGLISEQEFDTLRKKVIQSY